MPSLLSYLPAISTANPSSSHTSPLLPLSSSSYASSSRGSSSPTSSSSSSRPPSPPYPQKHSRNSSRSLLSFPSLTFSSPTVDLDEPFEKPQSSAIAQSASGLKQSLGYGHNRTGSLGGSHRKARRRRLVGQAVVVLGILGCVGYWSGAADTKWVEKTVWGKLSAKPTSPSSLLPGVVIGSNGVYNANTLPGSTDEILTTDLDPISEWGLDLSSSDLMEGLSPWIPNPPTEGSKSSSSLGHFADQVYKTGPLDMGTYKRQLEEFLKNAFPGEISEILGGGLERYLNSNEGESWDEVKNVWQIDKAEERVGSEEVRSWSEGAARGEGWKWDLVTDKEADRWVQEIIGSSRMQTLWDKLPSGILRSDTLRYLILLLQGGIYSDTDTNLMKSPSHWGGEAKLYKNGDGWMTAAQRARVDSGEHVDRVIGKPSVVVGIEADVGDREDWYDWWPRPLQIVQWTMASAPYHPISLSALLRIFHSTSTAINWTHEHKAKIVELRAEGRNDEAEKAANINVLMEPSEGGPVGVMAWTGPGVWTDAVLSYLRVKYGVVWTDLRSIREPLRIGDVVVLPVTGFSPGVGNFGSETVWHREAMVEHRFRGSWKHE